MLIYNSNMDTYRFCTFFLMETWTKEGNPKHKG